MNVPAKIILAALGLLAGVLWFMQVGPALGPLLVMLIAGVWLAMNVVRYASRNP